MPHHISRTASVGHNVANHALSQIIATFARTDALVGGRQVGEQEVAVRLAVPTPIHVVIARRITAVNHESVSAIHTGAGMNHRASIIQFAIQDSEPFIKGIGIASEEFDATVVAEMLWHAVHRYPRNGATRCAIAHIHCHTAIAH